MVKIFNKVCAVALNAQRLKKYPVAPVSKPAKAKHRIYNQIRNTVNNYITKSFILSNENITATLNIAGRQKL